jgi:hypothetical protein
MVGVLRCLLKFQFMIVIISLFTIAQINNIAAIPVSKILWEGTEYNHTFNKWKVMY